VVENCDYPTPFDWRSEWLRTHPGGHVSLLIAVGGEPTDHEGMSLRDAIDRELRPIVSDQTLEIKPFDPYVGAGGYGYAAIWEFLDRGADLLAWVGAVAAAARAIRAASVAMARKVRQAGFSGEVAFSREAIEILVVAEVCERHGLDQDSIAQVQSLEHNYPPPEGEIAKQQMHSAYTVAVSAFLKDGSFHVWSYLVTCYGRVIGASDVQVAVPMTAFWGNEAIAARKLDGLP
jgi:hypothetical protein